jgi:hypothetical protein
MATTTKPAAAVSLSPERQALADAQERLRQHDAAIAELRENREIRGAYLSECYDAIRAAEAELQDVAATLRREHHDKGPMGRAMSWTPAPEPPVRLAEAVETAKHRQIEAEASYNGIGAELRAAEDGRKRLHEAVDRAAMLVLAKHAADIGLADETERLQRDAYDKGLRLLWLSKAGVIEAKRQTLNRVEAYQGFWDLDDVDGLRTWTAARDRLMSDPTAEIPE